MNKVIKNSLILFIESLILSLILLFIIQQIDTDLLVSLFYPIELPLPDILRLTGLIISSLGLILIAWANYILLHINKIGLKDREPFHVPSSLALTGPYKFSRNPIYFGAIVMVFGLFILSASITILILNCFCFLLFRFSFVKWEEEKLEEKFGQNYLDFKKRVRRWI